ncbi:MAG: hypothetical protein LBJ12_00690 [Oscillospiraceae bacterium]|jgi:hypothetical protein|nr:hypothetical protein [Oscillospiraceae bacterium]
MKKLLSVLLVFALIILPLAAVTTAGAAVFATVAAVNLTKSVNDKTTGGTPDSTTEPSTGTVTDPPTDEVTDPPADEETTTQQGGQVTDPTTKPTGSGGTTPTTKPSANTTAAPKPTSGGNAGTSTGVPSDKAAIIKAYQAAVTKIRNSNKPIDKVQVTSLGDFTGDEKMLKLTGTTIPIVKINIGNVVKSFLGDGTEGPWHNPVKEQLIDASKLSTADVTNASAKKNGTGFDFTIVLKSETNPKPGTSAIGHVTSDFPTIESVNQSIDDACKNDLGGITKRGPGGIDIGSMTFKTTSPTITGTVDGNGKFTALKMSFNFNAHLENATVKVIFTLGSGEWGETSGLRTLTYSKFAY